MKLFCQKQSLLLMSAILFFVQACGTPASSTPTAWVAASNAATAVPLSQQVTLTFISFKEAGQAPVYSISAQTPMLTGSENPHVKAFNKAVAELIQHEIEYFRKNVLAQMPVQSVASGSYFDAQYTLVSQANGIWSLKFYFSGYAEGAAHPYHYSQTFNYDLEQGEKLSLDELFPIDTDYLTAISKYCIAELSKRDIGFYGGFQAGAEPTPENYRNWSLTPDGLLITFDEYQVAPCVVGPQTITIPYGELKSLINPKGPLATVIR